MKFTVHTSDSHVFSIEESKFFLLLYFGKNFYKSFTLCIYKYVQKWLVKNTAFSADSARKGLCSILAMYKEVEDEVDASGGVRAEQKIASKYFENVIHDHLQP